MGKNLYFHFYLFFIHFFSIEFFEGVSRGGPYRWSMDRSVRWSVDPVRWTGPRTGGQCFRVTPCVLLGRRVAASRRPSSTHKATNCSDLLKIRASGY